MAKRRRVGNLLALAVLSALIERPMHPYEMAAVLRERGKDQDMKIKWGSLYTVVQNLEKHGLIEVAESARQGGRPERTIYRLTDEGQVELRDWIRELIRTPEREQPQFEAGLSVVSVLPPDEVASLLRQRLDDLEQQLAGQRQALADNRPLVPRLFLVEAEYDLAVREAEANWVRTLLGDLVTGSFAGLSQWRDWHATGEIPPELAALAESTMQARTKPAKASRVKTDPADAVPAKTDGKAVRAKAGPADDVPAKTDGKAVRAKADAADGVPAKTDGKAVRAQTAPGAERDDGRG